jgi:hypothetical protein
MCRAWSCVDLTAHGATHTPPHVNTTARTQGDVDTLTEMLKYSRQILSQVVDENRRR